MALRRFTSLLITFAFLVMSITGIVLFVAPKGRIANWTYWELFGLSKEEYGALHVTFMVLFIVGIGVHFWLNWKPFVSYLKNAQRNITLFSKETLAALAVTLVFIGGTLWGIPPFSTFLSFEESLKLSWENETSEPPYGHAELSSLATLAKRTGIPLKEGLHALHAKGFSAAQEESIIGDLARQYRTSPLALYRVMQAARPPLASAQASGGGEGGGFGKLSLAQASVQEGFDLQKVLAFLSSKQINATPQSTLRELSKSLGTTPTELMETLKREGNL